MEEDWLYDRLIHDIAPEADDEAAWRFCFSGDEAATLIKKARRFV